MMRLKEAVSTLRLVKTELESSRKSYAELEAKHSEVLKVRDPLFDDGIDILILKHFELDSHIQRLFLLHSRLWSSAGQRWRKDNVGRQ